MKIGNVRGHAMNYAMLPDRFYLLDMNFRINVL